MKKEKNYFHFIVFAICLIGFLYNSFQFYKYIHETSEFAGNLINITSKVLLTFYSIISALIIVAISFFLFKRLKLIFAIGLTAILIGINYQLLVKINYSHFSSYQPSRKEIIADAEKIFTNQKKGIDFYLKTSKRYSPSKQIVNEDENRILSYIDSILSPSSIGKDSKLDSLQLNSINTFLDFRFDKFEKAYFQRIRSAIQLDFISYSPNLKRFIVLLSYTGMKNKTDINEYSGIFFIAEKKNNVLELYNYSEKVNYNFYKRESILFSILTWKHLSSNLSNESEYKTHPQVLSNKFWSCPFFFSKVKLSSNEILTRFKTRCESVYEKDTRIYVKKEVSIIK